MKIKFEDNSFIEFNKSETDKIKISLGVKKKKDQGSILSITSVEITENQFNELISSCRGL